MHDPCTVAFDIKWPFGGYDFNGHRMRPTIVTIWHVDPERDASKKGLRGDDSCGWFTPPTMPEQRERMRKLGAIEYGCIFGKRRAADEGADYVAVCYEPSHYDAVYWAWRAIKREHTKPRYIWKYGRESGAWLTPAELDYIYSLANNPIDNLRITIDGVHDKETCGAFFMCVYRAFLRFNRPWWKHPRWHVHHWRIQWHFHQKVRRWLFDRCGGCGGRFKWGESVTGFMWDAPRPKPFRSSVECYHGACASKKQAEWAKDQPPVKPNAPATAALQ